MPRLKDYSSVRARLAQARPFLAGTVNWNYLTFEAEVKVGPVPWTSIFRRTERDSWSDWSTGATAGVEIPVSRRSSLSLLGTYNHFFQYGADFSGPSFSIIWRRYL